MGFTKSVARTVLIAGLLGVGLANAPTSARAQTVEDVRIDIHPLGSQNAIVTSVQGHTAWIKMPYRTKLGATAEFACFSDGEYPLATGKVAWITPVSPWEAFVVDVTATKTKFPINDYDDLWATGSFKAKQTNGPRPFDQVFAGDVTRGFYCRVPAPDHNADRDAVEPVHAYLAALRERKNGTAGDIVKAVEAAFVDPNGANDDTNMDEDGINYGLMYDNLRHFRRLKDMDNITNKLMTLLVSEAQTHTMVGTVPGDSLRPSRTPTVPQGQ